jgi:hypothetical protein
MRSILHLFDLYFGRRDSDVVNGLGTLIQAARPDLIAISVILASAHPHEFELARDFLQTLPSR